MSCLDVIDSSKDGGNTGDRDAQSTHSLQMLRLQMIRDAHLTN